MKSVFKPIVIAAMLTTAGFAAFSQTSTAQERGAMMGAGSGMQDGMGHHHMGKMDPAKMQVLMDKRNAALKASLKLSPAQEGAWSTYTAAMKLPTDLMAKRPDRAEVEKLPTPERIDRMKELRTKHMNDMTAAMDKRGDATKAFYATLTPEQQKVFDANAMRRSGRDGHKGNPRDAKPSAPAATPAKP